MRLRRSRVPPVLSCNPSHVLSCTERTDVSRRWDHIIVSVRRERTGCFRDNSRGASGGLYRDVASPSARRRLKNRSGGLGVVRMPSRRWSRPAAVRPYPTIVSFSSSIIDRQPACLFHAVMFTSRANEILHVFSTSSRVDRVFPRDADRSWSN